MTIKIIIIKKKLLQLCNCVLNYYASISDQTSGGWKSWGKVSIVFYHDNNIYFDVYVQ